MALKLIEDIIRRPKLGCEITQPKWTMSTKMFKKILKIKCAGICFRQMSLKIPLCNYVFHFCFKINCRKRQVTAQDRFHCMRNISPCNAVFRLFWRISGREAGASCGEWAGIDRRWTEQPKEYWWEKRTKWRKKGRTAPTTGTEGWVLKPSSHPMSYSLWCSKKVPWIKWLLFLDYVANTSSSVHWE